MVLHDAACQPIDQCRLAYAGLTYMQRVVLLLAAEYLDGAFQFGFATNERVLLVHDIVEAGHQLSPGAVFVIIIQNRIVGVFHFRNQTCQEVLFLTLQLAFEQPCSIAVLQFQQSLHQMGQVYHRCTRACHLLIGMVHHLVELYRSLRLVHFVCRHLLILMYMSGKLVAHGLDVGTIYI